MSTNVRKALTKNTVDVAQSLVSLKVAGDVLSDDLTNLTKVGLGNILRVTVAGTTYVVFADDPGATLTPGATSTPAVELAAGTHYVLCTGEYVQMSTNPSRKELIRT